MTTQQEIGIEIIVPAYDAAMRLILGVVISCENAILIFVILRRKLHDNKYFFAASLGFTDLSVGVSLIIFSPFSFQSKGSDLEWRSVTALIIFKVISTTMFLLSAVQMAIIALERYVYIGHPFLYERRLTPRVIRWTVVTTWAFGVSLATFYGVLNACLNSFCGTDSRDSALNVMIYSLIMGVFLYTIVIIITCVCYVLILLQVRRHRRAVASSVSGSVSGTTETTVPKWKEYFSCFKFFLTVFGAYLIMTSPYVIFHCLQQFFAPYDTISFVFTLMIYSNSGANFLVMVIIDKNFRDNLRKTICPVFRKR